MNKIIIILLLFVMQACTATKGIYDGSLKSTDPYKFEFKGSKSDLESFLKRLVIQNGFNIKNFDSQAQLLTTDYKELADDEKYNTNALMLVGASVSSQKGNLVFIYNNNDNVLQLDLSSFLITNAQLRMDAYSKTEISDGSTKLPQGHPLMMKFKNLLLKDPRFSLRKS